MKIQSLVLLPMIALMIQVGSAVTSAQTHPPTSTALPAQTLPPTRSQAGSTAPIASPKIAPSEIAPSATAQDSSNQVPVPPWARDLNLSAEQRSRLQKVHEQARQKGEALHQQLMAVDKQLRSLLQSDASIQQLRQQYQEVQKLRQQLDQNRFEALLGERQALTSEQLTMVIQRFRKQSMP